MEERVWGSNRGSVVQDGGNIITVSVGVSEGGGQRLGVTG